MYSTQQLWLPEESRESVRKHRYVTNCVDMCVHKLGSERRIRTRRRVPRAQLSSISRMNTYCAELLADDKIGQQSSVSEDQVIRKTEEFFASAKNHGPFEQDYSSKAVIRAEPRLIYNPNVIYTNRPVFKYTSPPKAKTLKPHIKHHKELWRNSAQLNNDTELEGVTIGKYFRNNRIGKSGVSVRDVDGRFIPTPPGGCGGGITSWSRWYDDFE